MSIGGRLEVLSKWFGTPRPNGAKDTRLSQWRANYEEACAIARYVRCMAERRPPLRSCGTQDEG